MDRHRRRRATAVIALYGVDDPVMLVAVDNSERFDPDATIGSFPLSLPGNTAAYTGQISKNANKHRIARDIGQSLMERVVRLFAGGTIRGQTPIPDLLP